VTETPSTSPGPTEVLDGTIEGVIEAAREKKARDLIVLDLRDSGGFTDYFVICSGGSHRQVKAIVEGIEARLKIGGRRQVQTEGSATDWVLIDCFDFVVHVFTPEARNFYSLERLWGNALRVEV
jgi:ribosome-associated protein|tara:strand:- start:431 stop:802 length:372 start_codon:yes stop_codon:yes gene_type:complete